MVVTEQRIVSMIAKRKIFDYKKVKDVFLLCSRDVFVTELVIDTMCKYNVDENVAYEMVHKEYRGLK